MSRRPAPPRVFKRLKPLLGTYVEVAADRPEVLSSAFVAIEKVHRLLSFQEFSSDLSRLNRSEGEWIELDPLSVRVLKHALKLTQESRGAFNCTVGGRMVELGVLPNPVAGRKPLPVGSAGDLAIRGNRARLKRPLYVTLDGIAKGFAVDLAVQQMKASGARFGWVNAGGDLRAFGKMTVPVSRRELGGELRLLGGLRQAAMASSRVGTERDPRFPGRIVSSLPQERRYPRSLAPGVWSVIARTARRADALTKVAAVTRPERRAALIRRLGGELIQ